MTVGAEAVVVEFPLRGDWVAAHTPAERIPSHGTDMLGQRYAYDFLRIDRHANGWKFFNRSYFHYVLLGVRLEECYCWKEPVYAPFNGVVVAAKDHWPERQRIHFLKELALVMKNAFVFNPDNSQGLQMVSGNYIILKMEGEEVYAFFAHATPGSILVKEGDEVQCGKHIANVGHTGNSTAPHLHFHLMDRANLLEAEGIPCRFRSYETYHNGSWCAVSDGIPALREFIRFRA